MDNVDIRALREDQFPAVLGISAAAFGEEYAEADAEAYRQGFPFERALCAFEGDKMVGTLAAAGRVRELTPGAIEHADAMFSSGTAPYCVTEF